MIDVVNEPFHAVPSYANALGGSGKTGWDWVITAFQWARKYCFPGVKLLINDYSILQDNAITTNYINLIDTLRVRGLVDGIGIQGHYFEYKGSGYNWPIPTLRSNLNRLAALGLPIYISEFDINEANDSTQLANYQIYFPLFWENPGVKGITLWGYQQPYTWLANAYLVRTDGTERPALQWLRIFVATPAAISPPRTDKSTARCVLSVAQIGTGSFVSCASRDRLGVFIGSRGFNGRRYIAARQSACRILGFLLAGLCGEHEWFERIFSGQQLCHWQPGPGCKAGFDLPDRIRIVAELSESVQSDDNDTLSSARNELCSSECL